jgi:hypothetical protein
MKAARSANKYNTVPDKQHDLMNNKTIMKLFTYKINPTT